ncbi:MAG TPA: Pls/PosA family non-ribosomal peptide synthetase, partial [Citricoccus sp.]
ASLDHRLARLLASVLEVDDVAPDAHFFEDLGADSLTMARFCARVRREADLPAVSIKDVYRHPSVSALTAALVGTLSSAGAPAAQDRLTGLLTEVLAGVLGRDQVAPDADFFEDLGADSLTMARFCARVRREADLPAVSIKDVYRYPTVTALASSLTTTVAPAGPAEAPTAEPAAARPATAGRSPVTTGEYVLCGALQALALLAYTLVFAVLVERGVLWVWAGAGLLDHYLRGAGFGAVTFVSLCTLPVVAKWALIGRWTPREIRMWSLDYVRFWLVRTLVVSNPLVLFAGTPLYLAYLRALGVQVGRGAVVLTRHVPVCTDLVTIGAHAVIDKDSFLNGYRALSGVIQTGPVSIGRGAFVGEKAVFDIGTSVGDGAQLGHASSLHEGQAVPAGERWHGSPGQPTRTDYRTVGTTDQRPGRRAAYVCWQLVGLFGVSLPGAFAGLPLLLDAAPGLSAMLWSPTVSFTSGSFYGFVLVTSLIIFFGRHLLGLLVVATVPRLLNTVLRPDRTYPLYGFHFACHRAIEGLTNRRFFHDLFGDSSAIVHYLRALGYRLTPVVQTGSNFGTEIKHDNPYLVSVGSGTVVASGISIVNATYSSTSFSVSRSSLPAGSFFGNEILYPPGATTGRDCLIATKALVPIDGPVREGVGLLGSPAFEIPRTVQRDSAFVRMAHDEDLPRRLAAKNRHNLVTAGLFLLARWFQAFVATLTGFLAVDLYFLAGEAALAAAMVLTLLSGVFLGALVERASTGFKPLRPKYCSIYDVDFWRTERFFKLEAEISPLFNGTPFKGVILRMLGVRVGRRLFDDGAQIAEKNLVALGDDVALNTGAWIQCHSQEDYAFKSDAITIGSRCAVGVSAMVLYGARMDHGAELAADSFLMKGAEVPAGERWGGNPAEALTD